VIRQEELWGGKNGGERKGCGSYFFLLTSAWVILPIVIHKEYFHGGMQCSEKQAPIVLVQ